MAKPGYKTATMREEDYKKVRQIQELTERIMEKRVYVADILAAALQSRYPKFYEEEDK